MLNIREAILNSSQVHTERVGLKPKAYSEDRQHVDIVEFPELVNEAHVARNCWMAGPGPYNDGIEASNHFGAKTLLQKADDVVGDGSETREPIVQTGRGNLPRYNGTRVVPKGLECIVFREDASYLLAGGLGGIGRSISKWMVKDGARNLFYVSRRGLSSPKAAKFISELESAGARTKVLQCDVADEEKLKECLSEALTKMPPVRGVINGAMDLKDSVFTNMPFDSFKGGLRPKVQGSWSLHQATLQQPLDFFVMLTSGAAFFGSVGQANYVAASAYDVGKVVDMGYVVEDETGASGRNLNHLGMPDVHEAELLAILEKCMLLPPWSNGNGDVPNGYVVTGIHSTNDPSQGVEWPFWSRDPVFSHMDFVRPHLRKAKNEGDASAAAKKPLPELLGEAPSLRDAETHVLEALLRKLARALMMSLEDLDAKRPMSSYGVDSLIAVELPPPRSPSRIFAHTV
ncbi:hypothetical protein DL770_002891 [Monosporascus sp. CRB-9-2]|nr:hypothetical protein DL770_002891 [Monosporascus sp. CRB-9-2]